MEPGVHPADRRAAALLVAQAAQFADSSPLGVGAKQVCCASAARQLFGLGFAAGPAAVEMGLLICQQEQRRAQVRALRQVRVLDDRSDVALIALAALAPQPGAGPAARGGD